MHLKKSQNKILEEMDILEEQLQEDILPNLSKPDKIRLLEFNINRHTHLVICSFQSIMHLRAPSL